MKRKDNSLTLDDLVSAFNNDRGYLFVVISGHLLLEYLLTQLIESRLKHPHKFQTANLRFPQKVELCQALDFFGDDFGAFLIKLNHERNKAAHDIRHATSFQDVLRLLQQANSCGIEFTDDIHKNSELALEAYESGILIGTLFTNTAHHLACILDANGGDYCFL